MLFKITRILLFLPLFAMAGSVQAQHPTSPCGPWRPHIGPEVQGGNFKRGGGADGWFPLIQKERSILFAQGGGGWFRDAGVGSLGVGYRQIQCDRRWALGVNGFVDFAYSDLSRSPFGQVGAGFELFECHWIARGNLYVPFTKSKELQQGIEIGSIFIDGTQVIQQSFFNSSRESAFPGVDGEVGYEGELGCGRLGLYGGYFYYKRDGISAIHGPRARVEYRIDQGSFWPNNRGEFIIGAEYERDRLHGQTALIRAGWRFFLGCHRKNCCCYSPLVRYMGRRVMREKAIWIDEITSRTLISEEKIANIFFANNLNNGIGTQTDPALLPNAIASLGGNDILFLLQNTGDITATSTVTTLEGDQVLGFGNASSRDVTIPGVGTFTVNDLTGAGRAILIGTGLDPVIEAGNNNFLCGFTLQDGVTGIRHSGGNNLQIEDVIVNQTTGTAILNDLGGTLLIQQSQISTASGIGIRATQPTAAVTIGGLTPNDVIVTAPFGIFIDAVATPTRIMNTQVTSTGGDCIRITDSTDARVESSTLMGRIGLNVVNTPVLTNRDIRLLNSMITATFRGVSADLNGNGVFVISSGNQITSTGGAGIFLTPGGLGPWNILIDSNTISGTTNAITGSGATGSAIQLSNNIVMAGNNQAAITWLTTDPPMGTTINVSFLNNQELGVSGTGAGFEVRTLGGFGLGNLCATFIGNNRDVSNANDITISRVSTAGLIVWDLANLSATNNGLQVNTTGAIGQAAGPCPLPVIP